MLWVFLSITAPLRFLAPGAGTLEVTSPGRYIVWNEYRGTFKNRMYRAEPEFPDGVRFTILAPDGVSLPLGAAGSQSWSEGDAHRRAVGGFVARAAGRYSVVVEGGFPARVIAVGPDFLGRMIGGLFGAAAALLLGVGGGIGVTVYALGRSGEQRSEPAAAPGAPPPATEPETHLLEMVTLVYALQATSILVGVTMIGGLVIDYLKRDEAAGTWLESHIRWQIRTFWWTLAWMLIGFVTLIIVIGIVVLLAAAIWFVYRVARGWVALRARRPLP